MIEITKYSPENKHVWNGFVKESKNGTFLFNRGYMEYHSDRFIDHSLLIYEDGKLMALLPANLKDSVLYSHGGLTYGGIISSMKMKTPRMLEVFAALIAYLKREKIKKMVYKSIPYIFHKYYADEDLYALFINEAKLVRRDVSSAIMQNNKPSFERGRKRQIKKAKEMGLAIKESQDYEVFFSIVKSLLNEKYKVNPVHDSEEMQMLASKFPDNIKLFGCFKGDEMISGSVMYVTDRVAHAQYIFSTKEGKEIGANDLMDDFLINQEYSNKYCFNFGISTTDSGRNLNQDLISQKEMFGSRAVCFDWYELDI